MPCREWDLSVLHLPIIQNLRSWPRTVLGNRDHRSLENNRKHTCSVLCMKDVCPLTFRPVQPRSTKPVDGPFCSCVCKAFLSYNSRIVQFPHFKCTVQWLLVYYRAMQLSLRRETLHSLVFTPYLPSIPPSPCSRQPLIFPYLEIDLPQIIY